jgi:hypothetical protein
LKNKGKDYLIPTLGVDLSYLQAGLDQLATNGYASVYAYLIQSLGLTLADIYVLRAKMVYFSSLPGQGSFVGNAASGAAFLNALQNSPLSGRYTSYNYYLQSAIDAGTLGGVQNQIGGQVRTDTASYLSRLAFWVDSAITPYVKGSDLGVGQSRVWLAGWDWELFRFARRCHRGRARWARRGYLRLREGHLRPACGLHRSATPRLR